MDIRKEYGTDSKKEIEGVWEDFGDGCEVLIARIGNEEYSKYFQKISRPYKKQIRRDTLHEDKARELLVDSMAEKIVLSWKGLKEDGKLVPYTKKEAIRVLNEYKDFRDAIMEIAGEMETFKNIDDEDAEKNSKKS